MKVIVTGGAGFIGSHTVIELANAGMQPVIVDNFSNSHHEVLKRLETITGRRVELHEADVTDSAALDEVFLKVKPDAVIHFAGFKAVGTSVADPLSYYHNNVLGLVTVCETMKRHGVKNFVFSSSATVYTGHPILGPVTEEFPLAAINPYGQTKLMCEQILKDVAASDPSWRVAMLRYFNPIGAHESGLIGEDPQGIPDNLTPFVAQVLVGRLPYLQVFGRDYDTKDGTGVRDYLHVVDLARAHVKALQYQAKHPGIDIFNLGTGQGHSVMEVVAAFEKASGRKVACKFAPRRPGDVSAYYADPSFAERTLGWKAEKSLEDMCADIWNWQSKNPNGYKPVASRETSA
ncbi:MAG TPA: UDP-glucose 4-epimerase GalE [Candidatus Saccharimonadia bacterium]|nr:UDP-glucose 4-epimerase GalE [Candidatus Saccharimonadia bacterium]